MGEFDYVPDQENDLLCLMEQYRKAGDAQRPSILQNIRCCMDGQPYSNPFAQYEYSKETVSVLQQLLSDLPTELAHAASPGKAFVDAVCSINTLNSETHGYLLDTWRIERLEKMLMMAAAAASVENPAQLIWEYRQW